MSNQTIKILELGCGEGYRAHILAKKQENEVIGVDLSAKNIEFAKSHYPFPKFFQMSAEKLEFPNNSFDIVYAMDVLEHVDDLQSTANEISRVMKPGGKLVVNVPAEKSEHWLLSIRPTYFKEIHHVRIFKEREMENLFETRGFQVLEKISKGFLDHIPLYFVFTQSDKSENQLRIGNWNADFGTKLVSVFFSYFKSDVLQSKYMKLVPIWIITIPIGWIINMVGNGFMPKSIYFEFRKLNA